MPIQEYAKGCLMNPHAMKKEWIWEAEERFARDLARAVIEVPRLNIWMILIPIILVYHVFRHNKAVQGRTAFVKHYLLSRSRALDEACLALAQGRPPNIDEVVQQAVDLPDCAQSAYKAWIVVLSRHYSELLQAQGAGIRELIMAVYHNRTNYLLHLHQLNQMEAALNTALKNHVADIARDVEQTIARIETHTAELRRLRAELYFP